MDFVVLGLGRQMGARGVRQIKPYLQMRLWRRDMAILASFGPPCEQAAGCRWGAAGGRGQSASGSWPEAAAPRYVHVRRRWSKPRWFTQSQRPSRPSHGRRSVGLGLWEAALTHHRRAALSATHLLFVRYSQAGSSSGATEEASARAAACVQAPCDPRTASTQPSRSRSRRA